MNILENYYPLNFADTKRVIFAFLALDMAADWNYLESFEKPLVSGFHT